MHDVANVGFGKEAAAYERSRPGYPPDAVAWLVEQLGITSGTYVADVAAGTGKLTRLLTETAATVFAVEPVSGMAAHIPGVPVAGAVAEALPVRTGALDAITVAQAFHWFDARAALAEFHRALRPGGRIGLVYNEIELSEPWVDAIWAIPGRLHKPVPWADLHTPRRFAAFTSTPYFTVPLEGIFHHVHESTPDQVVDRIRSISHVAALPHAELDRVLDDVRRAVDDAPLTADGLVALPYRVDVQFAARR